MQGPAAPAALLCGKALPFRPADKKLKATLFFFRRSESRRLSAQRSGKAAGAGFLLADSAALT